MNFSYSTQWKLRYVMLALLVAAGGGVSQSVEAAFCTVSDSGGTAELPPVGCDYTTPDTPILNNDLFISVGLPAGTYIQMDAVMHGYSNISAVAGGGLGGEKESYSAFMFLPMVGHGVLNGFNRLIQLPILNESHSAARISGMTPQSFITQMYAMQGQITGDPDFDLLRIAAGNGFGLPSPGQTILTRSGPPGSNWNVESFFDITYRIDFIGAPGSLLGGQSGSTTGTARFILGMPIPEPSSVVIALSMLGRACFVRRCLGVV